MLEEFPHVFFALSVCVGLIKQRKSFNENVGAFPDYIALQIFVKEESFQYLDGGEREVAVAQTDQEMVLHFVQYMQPTVKFVIFEPSLHACIKYLDVGPFKIFKLQVKDSLFKRHGNQKTVPFLWGAIGSVLFSVGAANVDFLFGAR